jgi:hypothetical protein
MPKVFTLDFMYEYQSHQALVSIQPLGAEYRVSLQVLDDGLSDILPDGTMHFRVSDKPRQPGTPGNARYQRLESLVRQAVRQKLLTEKQNP